jgi:hypothetical protein
LGSMAETGRKFMNVGELRILEKIVRTDQSHSLSPLLQ